MNTSKQNKTLIILAIVVLTSAVFILNNSFTYTQKTNIKTILNKLNSFSTIETHEVLYLHTNGNVFLPGDTIWFKAYNLKSGFLFPSNLSTLLHVELQNLSGEQKIETKFKLRNGFSNGQLELPDSLKTGTYIISAASNYTANYFPDDFFQKKIEIQNNGNKEVLIKISLADSLYSPLNLVQGELEIIGDKNSRIGKVKTLIQLKQGQNILAKKVIQTDENGIGKFELTIPENIDNEVVSLNAEIQHNGLEGEFAINIPIKELLPIIRFFPEGGQLIEGIKTKIAFEAVDRAGNPLNFEGIITDTKGQKISDVSSEIMGLGSVNLQAQKGEKLFLKILKPKNYDQQYELPQALEQGYSLKISDNNSENIHLKVESNASNPTDSVSILLFLRGKVWFSTSEQIKDLANFSIPIKDMPMGVAKITLFDKSGIPQAERLVFLNLENKLVLSTDSVKNNYEKKEKVTVDIHLKNHLNEPETGFLSLSVSPVNTAKDLMWSENIMASLLLCDELNGDIPYMNYYFSGNKGSKEALELLMLTRGWRKFSWKNVFEFNQTEFKNDVALSGSVFLKNGKPVTNIDVTLMNVNTFNAVATTTNDSGYFSFKASEYQGLLDESSLVLTASRKSGNKNVIISLNSLVLNDQASILEKQLSSDRLKNFDAVELFPGKSLQLIDSVGVSSKNYYSDITKRNFWVEDVEIKQKRPVVIPIEVFEKEHMVYELDDDEILINFGANEQSGILQLIHKVAGHFKVIEEGGKILFRGYNSLYTENMQGAIFVINGQYASSNYHDLNYLNADDIENIKVTKSSAAGLIYSSFGTSGLIEITTKGRQMGKFKSKPVKTDKNIISVAGYSLAKEFYSPVYHRPEEKNKSIDLRTTLFWEPNIVVNESGNATFQFYNSDISGEYELRIEGISRTGTPVYVVKRYFVN